MRNNQVEIKVTRFNDEIPKTTCIFPEEDIKTYTISTYIDSNNVFEALAAAYFNILKAIKEDEDFPKFGDSGDVKRTYKVASKKEKPPSTGKWELGF